MRWESNKIFKKKWIRNNRAPSQTNGKICILFANITNSIRATRCNAPDSNTKHRKQNSKPTPTLQSVETHNQINKICVVF